jgi:hypothetical protein
MVIFTIATKCLLVPQLPQRHPCHAEQSEASRIFWLLQSRDSATVPQDDIATRYLKGEEVNTVDEIKREQSMI